MNETVRLAAEATAVAEHRIDNARELLASRRPINAYGVYQQRRETIAMLRSAQRDIIKALDSLYNQDRWPTDADYDAGGAT
jgi:hypothetical protein